MTWIDFVTGTVVLLTFGTFFVLALILYKER